MAIQVLVDAQNKVNDAQQAYNDAHDAAQEKVEKAKKEAALIVEQAREKALKQTREHRASLEKAKEELESIKEEIKDQLKEAGISLAEPSEVKDAYIIIGGRKYPIGSATKNYPYPSKWPEVLVYPNPDYPEYVPMPWKPPTYPPYKVTNKGV